MMMTLKRGDGSNNELSDQHGAERGDRSGHQTRQHEAVIQEILSDTC
jgi:hypothetical protein